MADKWPEVRLGDHFSLGRGISYRSADLHEHASEEARPLLNLKCVERGGGFRPEGVKFHSGATMERHMAFPGDLLIACTDLTRGREVVGAPILVPSEGVENAVFSLDLVLLRPVSEDVDRRYFALVLQHEAARSFMQIHSSGTTVIHLKLGDVPDFRFRLPPPIVQRRVVDLIAHVDSHLANLRAESAASSRSASALRSEMFANLRHDTVQASEMFDMLLGRQKSARQSVGDYVLPYIRAANIGEHGMKLDDVQTMNFEPAEQARYGLHEEDILLVEGGSVGIAARWDGQVSGVVGFDKHVIRLRARVGRSISEYGLQWANWCRESGAFDEQATGITIRALGFGRASAMPVPNLTVEEQEQFCAPLAAAAALVRVQRTEVDRLVSVRGSLLSLLLSGEIDVPVEYDDLLSEVA